MIVLGETSLAFEIKLGLDAGVKKMSAR